ncbi:uncharacterized lipoprotein Rv2585c/MT2662 [Arthrobacter sp. Hiyo4]|nr:uncharacterized lipoprotein Rv2585c/MT2662 [Arthrobacter sp. Hiyo4]
MLRFRGAPPVVVGETNRGGSATVAEVNAFTSFNPFSADGNTDINTKIGHITHSGFYYVDDTEKVVRNDKFGRIEKISDKPLKVKYTVSEGVKWSDGEAIDAGDLLLSWAAGSGYFDDAEPLAGTGTTYFSAAADKSGLGPPHSRRSGVTGAPSRWNTPRRTLIGKLRSTSGSPPMLSPPKAALTTKAISWT